MKLFSLTGRFTKLMYPIAREVVKERKWQFITLLLLSILLGTIPTIKSELEAAFLQQSADVVRRPGVSHAFTEFLSQPPDRLRQPRNDMDAIESFTHRTIGDLDLRADLFIYFTLVVLTWLLGVLAKKVKAGIMIDVFRKVREKGFTAVMGKEPYQLPDEQQQTGKNANAVHQGTINISDTFGYLIDAGQYLITLATALYLLASVSIAFTGLFILLLSIQVLITFLQNQALKKQRNQLDEKKNTLSAYTNEILNKKEIILAYDQGDKYRDKLSTNSQTYATIERKLDVRQEFYSGLISLVSDLDRVILPVFVVFAILEWGLTRNSKIGDIYFVISLFTRLSVPATNLLYRYTDIKKSEAISASFLTIVDPLPVVVATPPPPCASDKGIAVRFDKVHFSYPDHPNVLHDYSCSIPRNKITVILGPSGCGKTSIARLILGFERAQSGQLCINGQNIDTFASTKQLRELLSYVSQGHHIVEETVRENLNWPSNGQPIDDAKLLEVLRQVEIRKDNITKDILHEQAKHLSGGEQQRLSLARMLLDDSPIIILDEPMTGVDVFTINKILPHLLAKMKKGNNTFIIISHKALFIKYADHVILFDEDSHFVGEGSPAALIHQSHSPLKDILDASRNQLDF